MEFQSSDRHQEDELILYAQKKKISKSRGVLMQMKTMPIIIILVLCRQRIQQPPRNEKQRIHKTTLMDACANNLRIHKTSLTFMCQKSENSENLHTVEVPKI
jgi:hypothetical protein